MGPGCQKSWYCWLSYDIFLNATLLDWVSQRISERSRFVTSVSLPPRMQDSSHKPRLHVLKKHRLYGVVNFSCIRNVDTESMLVVSITLCSFELRYLGGYRSRLVRASENTIPAAAGYRSSVVPSHNHRRLISGPVCPLS